MALEGAIRYPTAFDVLVHNAEGIDVTEIRITNLHCNGTRLAELGFPGDVIVLSLKRDGAIIIPHGDTVLQMQDRLGLIGRPASIEEAAALLKR
jgi:Trk K+ transport system NAD-binding subunit